MKLLSGPLVLSLNLLLLSSVLSASAFPPLKEQDFSASPEYQAAITEAQSLLNTGRYKEAVEAFNRANKLARKRSPDAYLGIAQASLAMRKYKDTRKNAEKALKYTDRRVLRARAYNLIGSAWTEDSKLKEKPLKKAAEAFQSALELLPDVATFHFNLGYVLLGLEREKEGVEALRKYLALEPDGPQSENARLLTRDPRRVRLRRSPDFKLKTREGEEIGLADLKGKVVLLDFWATWCGPCRYSVPFLRDLNGKLADKDFLIISISADDHEKAWEEFIEKEKMVWRQCFDGNGRMNRTFGIEAFPTFVVIDGEGLIRERFSGWGGGAQKTLEEGIAHSLEMLSLVGQSSPTTD